MLELRGAEPEATNRKYGVTAATLTGRPEAFLEGGESGLKIRATDVVDEKQKTLLSTEVPSTLQETRRGSGSVCQPTRTPKPTPTF